MAAITGAPHKVLTCGPMPTTTRLLASAALALAATAAHANCTLVADAATRAVLLQEGDCATRITPASTFKIALSLMGYDAGFLTSAHAPVLHYEKGDPDWRDSWLTDTDPQKWIRDSVVWYSQRVTAALGEQRFQRYVSAFHYGNEDVSGDPVLHDGLKWAWIASSLKISPQEQLAFLEKIVRRELPVSAAAYEMTGRITLVSDAKDAWTIHGKPGSASPHLADGRSDDAHAYGWFVGWAEKGGRTLVFVRQTQDASLQEGPAGLRARDAFLPGLPALLDRL